jgi:Lamin Tail Domain/Alpha galactosidase A/NPCBM-associated, NEW3 domain of alpha-galactosidase/MBG domain (YGX type)/Alpha galactosidase C-terminal beta sandwich domain
MRRLTLAMATVLTTPLVAIAAMASPVARAPAARADDLKPAVTAENPNPLHAGEKPVLGWSSWSTFRHVSNAAIDEAEARAMVSDGLAAEGYDSINQDDGWYTCYPVSYTQPTLINGVETMNYGPGVDQWGMWTTSQLNTSNTGAFPNDGSINGMQVLGDYLHSLGLKFGIYLTPGISGNALAQNTPVEANANGKLLGTPSGYTAQQITLGFTPGLQPAQYPSTLTDAENYNCGGTWELNYNSPGAQEFVDAEADEFASWGVDFVKLDGILDQNTTDLQAWSKALNQTGRPIELDATEGVYDIAIAPTLDKYATQWEYSPDIESGNTGLTSYQSADVRFNTAALWAPYGGAGKGFNDLDSVEIGNGQTPGNPTDITGVTTRTDGLSLDGRESVLALWSLASSPLILGSDLTTLNPTQNPVDYALLMNKQVLEVDQDSIDAQRIVDTPSEQVFAKTERGGDTIVGLFNTNYGQSETISTSAAALGLPGHGPYLVQDLYGNNSDLCAPASVDTANPTPTSVQTPLCAAGTPTSFETAGTISANVPPEGVALYRITPITWPSSVPPSATVSLSGMSTLTAGEAATATATFTNNGARSAHAVNLSLSAPSGWSSTATSQTTWPRVASGQTVQATFSVAAPTADTTGTVSVTASYSAGGRHFLGGGGGEPVVQNVSDPVRVVSAPVEINEVQTGTVTTPNQQFVELYNPAATAADVSGWQLEYTGASAGRGTPVITTLATLPSGTSIAPGGYYLIGGAGYAAAGTLPADNQSFTQTSTTQLSQTGGGIALADSTGFVVDSLGYGVNVNSGYAISAYQRASNEFVESCPAQSYGVIPTVTDTTLTALFPTSSTNTPSIPDGDSLVRLPDGASTGSNCDDFAVTSTPTPGASNIVEPQLTITASSATMRAGQRVPAITASYSGFVNGDSAASLPIAPTCWTDATSWSPPGTYPTYCSGAADPNYTIDAGSYVSGILTVRP